MESVFRDPISQREEAGRIPVAKALKRLLLAGALFLTHQAYAGHTYRLAGNECTDSNRPEVFYPDAGETGAFGPGPVLCSKQVFAEITLGDKYVPGSFFQDSEQGQDELTVESFSFSDGAHSVTTTFPRGSGNGLVQGTLPKSLTATALDIFWFEGWFFRTMIDGTWIFGEEFGARDGVCGLGSIEGPNLSGTACVVTPHYNSVGTYTGWTQVSEPPAPLALALGVAAMAGLRRRRK